LTTPLGPAGPVFNTTLTADALAKIPLYSNDFHMDLGQIVTSPFTLDVTALPQSAGLLQSYTWIFNNIAVSNDGTSAEIDFTETSSFNPDNQSFDMPGFGITESGSILDFGTTTAPRAYS